MGEKYADASRPSCLHFRNQQSTQSYKLIYIFDKTGNFESSQTFFSQTNYFEENKKQLHRAIFCSSIRVWLAFSVVHERDDGSWQSTEKSVR